MPDEPDYIVEIGGKRLEGSQSASQAEGQAVPASGNSPRPFISVLFDCCRIYQRIYKNRAGTAYEGVCSRCGRPIKVKIGPGGTNCRFFRAT